MMTSDPNASTEANTYHRLFIQSMMHIYLILDLIKQLVQLPKDNANTSQIDLNTNKFGTANTLYGVEITVNTSFLGVTTSDTRIIEWTGAVIIVLQ